MKTKHDATLADALPGILDGLERAAMLQNIPLLLGEFSGLIKAVQTQAATYSDDAEDSGHLEVLDRLLNLPKYPKLCARIVDLLIYDEAPRFREYELKPLPDLKTAGDLVSKFGFAWCDEELRSFRLKAPCRKPSQFVACMGGRDQAESTEALEHSVKAWGYRFATPHELALLGAQHPKCFAKKPVLAFATNGESGQELDTSFYDESASEDGRVKRGKAFNCYKRDIANRLQDGALVAVVRL